MHYLHTSATKTRFSTPSTHATPHLTQTHILPTQHTPLLLQTVALAGLATLTAAGALLRYILYV